LSIHPPLGDISIFQVFIATFIVFVPYAPGVTLDPLGSGVDETLVLSRS
jgi:hypothetical protein